MAGNDTAEICTQIKETAGTARERERPFVFHSQEQDM
jgi:hypothetical protein